MRAHLFAAVAAACFAFPASAFSQEIEVGPGGIRVAPHYSGRSASRADCAELRAACLHKEEVGEEGQGNCHRYRKLCQRD
jgi:hypothetical protein